MCCWSYPSVERHGDGGCRSCRRPDSGGLSSIIIPGLGQAHPQSRLCSANGREETRICEGLGSAWLGGTGVWADRNKRTVSGDQVTNTSRVHDRFVEGFDSEDRAKVARVFVDLCRDIFGPGIRSVVVVLGRVESRRSSILPG